MRPALGAFAEGKLAHGFCPDCNGERFYLGPRGGASRNIECAGCGERFNIVLWLDRVIPLERIGRGARTGAFWEPRAVRLVPEEDT